jgi:WD40 repeat protein
LITTLEPSPDETLLATGGENWVRLWEISSGQLVAEFFTGHQFLWQGVAFSPDGRTLAYGLPSGEIELWDVPSRSPVGKLLGHRSEPGCLRFSPDGKRLISGSYDPERTVKVWDMTQRQFLANVTTSAAWISRVLFSPEGNLLAIAGADQLIRLVYTDTWEEKARFRGHVDEIWGLTFSPDGTLLASASRDRTIRLWDTRLNNRGARCTTWMAKFGIDTLPKHGGAVLAWRPEGCYSVIPIPDLHARRDALKRLPPSTTATVSPDGCVLALGLTNGVIVLRNESSGSMVELRSGATNPVVKLGFAPSGQYLAAVRADHTMEVWDAVSWHQRLQATIRDVTKPVFSFSRQGNILGFLARDNVSPELWDLTRQLKLPPLADAFRGPATDMVFSSDGKLVAIASDDGHVKVWDVATGRQWMTLSGQFSAFLSVAFSADDRRIAASGLDGTIQMWDLESRQMVSRMRGEGGGITGALSFLPDGNTMVAIDSLLKVTRLPTLADIDRQDVEEARHLSDRFAGSAFLRPWAEMLPGRQPAVTDPSQGGLRRQVYFGIPGSAVADLTNNHRFPDHPDRDEMVPTFESTDILTTHYGERLSGYLIPPLTGDYVFYLAADDQAQLWLSTDESPANKRLILEEITWSAPRSWRENRVSWITAQVTPPRISAPIFLRAGQPYYVELLHKQGVEDDSAGVTWQLPGDPPPSSGSAPISGEFLRATLAPALPGSPR